jgi:hypothetical protein
MNQRPTGFLLFSFYDKSSPHQETSSHAGAEHQLEEALCRDASPAILAKRSDVGVDIDLKRAVPFCFHHLLETDVSPGWLVQWGHDSLFPVQRSTDRGAHAQDLLSCRYLADHAVDVRQIRLEANGCIPSDPS